MKEEDIEAKGRWQRSRLVPGLTLSLALSFLLGLYAPLELYFTNITEFQFDFWALLPPLLGLFGILFAAIVIVFYLVFIVRGMLIALDARETYDALLVFGCTCMLSLQAFIIIVGVIKLIPLTGITLPFISYGGSSLLSSMLQLGILEGVAIKNSRREEEELQLMGEDIL